MIMRRLVGVFNFGCRSYDQVRSPTLSERARSLTDQALAYARLFFSRRRTESRYLAWLAQHLVDLAEVHLFCGDHLTRVLFQEHRTISNQIEQLLIQRQSGFLSLERLREDIVDAVFL